MLAERVRTVRSLRGWPAREALALYDQLKDEEGDDG